LSYVSGPLCVQASPACSGLSPTTDGDFSYPRWGQSESPSTPDEAPVSNKKASQTTEKTVLGSHYQSSARYSGIDPANIATAYFASVTQETAPAYHHTSEAIAGSPDPASTGDSASRPTEAAGSETVPCSHSASSTPTTRCRGHSASSKKLWIQPGARRSASRCQASFTKIRWDSVLSFCWPSQGSEDIRRD